MTESGSLENNYKMKINIFNKLIKNNILIIIRLFDMGKY